LSNQLTGALGPTTGTNLRSHSITTFNHYDRRIVDLAAAWLIRPRY
jgi:hypothetical protein